MQISRREFLACASALLLARPASAQPARLARKDCFFGLHFDLHPNAGDTELGRDVTDQMVAHLLDSCKPDFIQYDSKGDLGYLGYPSKTGMSAPGIVQDSLAVWRRVTASRGVALYNHFTGIRDSLAATRHPDWARVGPDGKKDPTLVSIFSPYENELMIPELLEAAIKYDLDGAWIDGDCWGDRCDYSEASRKKFLDLTGDDALPLKLGDKDWDVFIEMQREELRQYVSRYVDALHKAKPGFQITSNFMYSTFMPEKPTVPLDFVSADLSAEVSVREGRLQARYMARNGIPWDLMSWAIEIADETFGLCTKSPAELQQEAAVIIAQGGAYQIYFNPTRSGWVDDRIVNTATEVGKFVRQRQRWSHHSDTVPEVGVLYSSRTMYKTGQNPFGGWGEGEQPVEGAIDLMLSMGYSVDIIPDWQLALYAAVYPLIVVPDWGDLGSEALDSLANYVGGGGKLLLFGAENARLFASAFNLRFTGPQQNRSACAADESGFAEVKGNWITIDAPPQSVVANSYALGDGRKSLGPLAVRVNHGGGTAVVFPCPISTTYAHARNHVLRSVVRGIAEQLHPSTVAFGPADPSLEVVIRTKDGQTLIHLINAQGAEASRQYPHTGTADHTGPIHLRLRLPAAPTHVFLEPEGTPLPGRYEAGEWHGTLPDLEIHSILRIPSII